MPFRIKNLTNYKLTVLGQNLQNGDVIDLKPLFSNAFIRQSLLTGELYHKMQGRAIALLSPSADMNSIGLSVDEIARLTNAGIFQGYLGSEELKPPFRFDNDGNLVMTIVHTAPTPVIGTVSVRGISADGTPADGFPVEIGGVDESGNVQSLLVDADGYLVTIRGTIHLGDEVEGRVFAGTDGTGIKPVIISGLDPAGLSRSMSVTPDGYVNSVAFGPVADGAPASHMPVEIGGVDLSGRIQSLMVDTDGYLMTSTALSIEIDNEVEGRVFAGADGTNIKPVIISGLDNAGLSRSMSVTPDGYVNSVAFGPVADGSPAFYMPVEIGGVDLSGNIQSLMVDADGYLMTSTAISIETNSEVEGRVLDGADATGVKPVIISGVDIDGYSQTVFVSPVGEVYVTETDPVNTTYALTTVVNETNQANNTYYYLIYMNNYRDLSLEMTLSANALVTIEAANDFAFAVPKDITKSGSNLVTNTNGYTSFTNQSTILDFDNLNITYVRVKLVISNPVNSAVIVARRKAL